MDGSDDFILVEDEDEVSEPEPSLPEAMPESQKIALGERLSLIHI